MKISTYMKTAALIAVIPLGVNAAIGDLPTPTSQSVGNNPRGLAVGTLTGAGSQQLAVANFGSGTFIGQSSPSSQTSSQRYTVDIFNLTPAGLGLVSSIPTGASPRGLSIFDLFGDDRPQLLVTAYDSNLLQAFEWKAGGFVKVDEAPTLRMPVGVAAGTVRNGGAAFAAVADYGADRVSVFTVTNGRFGKRTDVPVPGGPVQLAVGALGGNNGNLIAVACMNTDKLALLAPASPDPSSYAVVRTIDLPEGGSPADLRVADLNGDGRTDLVVADFSKNTIQIFLQQPGGDLAAQTPLSTSGLHPNGLTVGDLDGDGIPEIIVANRDSDTLDIFSATAGSYRLIQTFQVSEGTPAAFGPVEVGVMKGLGRSALVTTHMRSNSIKVLGLAPSAPKPSALEGGHGVPLSFSADSTYFYPNPAKGGAVKLHFDLAAPAGVGLQVYDLTGTLVFGEDLSPAQTQAGENNVEWDLTNQQGQPLASGTYIARVTTGGRSVTTKLAIVH